MKRKKVHDDWNIPVLPVFHLDVIDYVLVSKKQDEYNGNKIGTDKYDGKDPCL